MKAILLKSVTIKNHPDYGKGSFYIPLGQVFEEPIDEWSKTLNKRGLKKWGTKSLFLKYNSRTILLPLDWITKHPKTYRMLND